MRFASILGSCLEESYAQTLLLASTKAEWPNKWPLAKDQEWGNTRKDSAAVIWGPQPASHMENSLRFHSYITGFHPHLQ